MYKECALMLLTNFYQFFGNLRNVSRDLHSICLECSNLNKIESEVHILYHLEFFDPAFQTCHFKSSSNRCCHKDNELVLNQTLIAAKTDCMSELKKAMKEFDAAQENAEAENGFENMLSNDRSRRWKIMVTCAINCVAQKIGMVRIVFVLFKLFQIF
jgi:hypothetical protein